MLLMMLFRWARRMLLRVFVATVVEVEVEGGHGGC